MTRRAWTELVDMDDAISRVRTWVAECPTEATLLPVEPASGRRALEALQVSTRSPMGAIAFHTGGLLVDGGWLRVLGGGSAALPRTIDQWNDLDGAPRCEHGVLVADDAIGGFFAWFRSPQTVHYLAPDTFEWEDLELGYSDWLAWCLSERMPAFYAELRWEGWEREVAALAGDRGLHVWPPLIASGPPIGERSRRAVPVEELWSMALEIGAQLRDLPDGAQVQFTTK